MENNYDEYVTKNVLGFYNVKLPGAKLMLESGEFFVLDVRPASMFGTSHLKGAVNINNASLSGRMDEIPRDKKILLYCTIDLSSRNSGKKLIEAGFKEVYNMVGGFKAWNAEGCPVVSDS
ncbi:rhodanese-like domain-containing protein [Methanolobus sp. ZRKC3]|uniref:rhodanese-like domain-containing protein n=1 Tax=Methanolobus sp. ZRKC3 TaxID=3125786 RepID=UPI00324658C7